jgi:hypothetical protein
MIRGKGRGTAVCSNVQMALESKPKRIMANAVTNATGDRAWLRPRALQANAVLGCPFDAVADGGSSPGEEGKTCLEAGLTPYVARLSTSANQQRGLFSKDACT